MLVISRAYVPSIYYCYKRNAVYFNTLLTIFLFGQEKLGAVISGVLQTYVISSYLQQFPKIDVKIAVMFQNKIKLKILRQALIFKFMMLTKALAVGGNKPSAITPS